MYNQNIEKVLEVMKLNVPTIMTEKIVGIQVEVTEEENIPEKIVIVFET